MKEEQFTLEEQVFRFEKEETSWRLDLKRSEVDSQDLRNLWILDLHHPLFLEQSMTADQDQIHLTYQTDALGLSAEEIQALPVSDRLRLAINVLDLAPALELPVTFMLHPINLFVTKDAQVKIAYRGVPGIMVPRKWDQVEFLRQAKCYAVTLFGDWDFMELYQGTLELEDLPDFLVEIRDAASLEEMKALLEKAYQERKEEEEKTLTLVSSRQHRIFKLATVWLSAVVALLLLPLIYLVFFQAPFKEKLLQADTAYLKVDYTGVIDELEGVAPSSLPTTQKYELATSYLQGLNFSEDQKKVILNNVTLKSDSLYLHYWIYIGRHDFTQALDTAKRIDDSDLIIYALRKEIKATRDSEKLSGEQREKKLSELEGEYKKYWDARSKLLEAETDETKSSTSSSTTASSTEGSSTESSSSTTASSTESSDHKE